MTTPTDNDAWADTPADQPQTTSALVSAEPNGGMVRGGAGFLAGATEQIKTMPLPSATASVIGLAVCGLVMMPPLILYLLSRQTPSAVQNRQIAELLERNEQLAQEASKPRCIGICNPLIDFGGLGQSQPQYQPYPQPVPVAPASQPITYQQTQIDPAEMAYRHVASEWAKVWGGDAAAAQAYWNWAQSWKPSVLAGSQEPYAQGFRKLWAQHPESQP